MLSKDQLFPIFLYGLLITSLLQSNTCSKNGLGSNGALSLDVLESCTANYDHTNLIYQLQLNKILEINLRENKTKDTRKKYTDLHL